MQPRQGQAAAPRLYCSSRCTLAGSVSSCLLSDTGLGAAPALPAASMSALAT